MTSLTIYILLLTLAAILFVLVPVLRYRNQGVNSQSDVREKQNIELFQQNIDELDSNLSDKLIEQNEYKKFKLELERNFLNDMESGKVSKQKSGASHNKLLPLLLILFIPLSSFLLYRSIGSGQELVLPELIENLNNSESIGSQLKALNEIATILDLRFQRRGEDVRSGYTLGTLYISLEKYTDAVRVFTQLSEGIEEDLDKATVLGQLAQAQYLLADSILTTTVQNTIDQALQINSNEQAIMSILAVEALLVEDFAGAANYWRRQISQLPVSSGQIAQLNKQIKTIEAYLNEPEEGSGDADPIDVMANAVELTVTVSLDESILQQIEPGMTVFIFARSKGTPPLAAVTVSPEELPVTVILNDSMAMLPQFNLSSVQSAYVGASIARQAVAESGDFQVLSETFVIGEQQVPIILSIKDRLP